ncbi:MAG TPA: hypothetical protein VN721_16755 [Flavipsychrobacter sp.]|nr:hypothetical protein [Flavipsychrobacter sp.]
MLFRKTIDKNGLLSFCLLWSIVFVLYLPAARAGFVSDFPGWLDSVKNQNFFDYLNRKNSGIDSLYQFTQFNTYLFYKLLGTNPWLWHLLHITLHTINSFLLFTICRRIFQDSGIKNAYLIAICGAILYCVCPYISEVIVWKPSFHFLQGFLLILIILSLTQLYLYHAHTKYIWWAGILFFLSTYSLEVFYLTPLFVFTLILYYRLALNIDKARFKKALLYFLLPQALLFAIHIAVLKLVYGSNVAHIGAFNPSIDYLYKPPKYLFHILLSGRYLSDDFRNTVYHLCESKSFLISFYGVFVLAFGYTAFRFRKMSVQWKAVVLISAWVIISMSMLMPIWFPLGFYVEFDRYSYLLDAFVCMLLALVVILAFKKPIALAILFLYGLMNIYFTVKINKYWNQSEKVIDKLLHHFPSTDDKIVLLLDLPESLKGIPMIGAQEGQGFKQMHNLLTQNTIKDTVYDVMAYYMTTPDDGAHATVINDSTVRVTLNQWGTWWLREHLGAGSYQTEDYKVNMIDVGRYYDVVLKKPYQRFELLFQTGGKWHIVDWSMINKDQY